MVEADWQFRPLFFLRSAAWLFELLTGQAGATSGTLMAFDPRLRKSYSIEWKSHTAGGDLRVSKTGLGYNALVAAQTNVWKGWLSVSNTAAATSCLSAPSGQGAEPLDEGERRQARP